MMRSYSFDQSRRTPPILTNSATTSPPPRSLMLSMSETGNVLSRPTRIPTFFIARMSFQTVWSPESEVRSQTAVSESFVLTPDSRLTTPDFLPVYENSGLYMLASGVVNAGGGHPRKGFWHQLFWTSGGPPPAGTRAEGMCYNRPTRQPGRPLLRRARRAGADAPHRRTACQDHAHLGGRPPRRDFLRAHLQARRDLREGQNPSRPAHALHRIFARLQRRQGLRPAPRLDLHAEAAGRGDDALRPRPRPRRAAPLQGDGRLRQVRRQGQPEGPRPLDARPDGQGRQRHALLRQREELARPLARIRGEGGGRGQARQVQAQLPRLPLRAGHARPLPLRPLRGRQGGGRITGADRDLRRQDRGRSLRELRGRLVLK